MPTPATVVVFALGAFTLIACAPDDSDSSRPADAVAVAADTATPEADAHAAHGIAPDQHTAHDDGERTGSADAHAEHPRSSRPAAAGEHADHTAAAAGARDEHAEHAPAAVAPDPHAAHTGPAAPSVEHAGRHAQPGVIPDSVHQHPPSPAPDTVHHHPPSPADTVAQVDHAQHEMPNGMSGEMTGALGIPMQREASGTAWLPDASPMYALHSMRGRTMLMLHGVIYVNYIVEGGKRGDEHFGSTNWLMGMVKIPALGGHVTGRTMLSAEPVTVGRCGYPNLLATGETCHSEPLHDRQHPHDLFMELAGMYERELSPRVGLQLYGGFAGEPALGPVAYPHRISAISNPMAPISHHWHDATHISFGVFTAGLFGRTWKVEASAFNGREPDEERYNIDVDRLDSFAGRFWWLPSERWAMQVSSGQLKEAEPADDDHERVDVRRTTASASYHLPFARSSLIATTLTWGRNSEHGEHTNAVLLESNLDLGGRHIFFARAERAEKPGHDLGLQNGFAELDNAVNVIPGGDLENKVFTVHQLTGGYLHQLRPISDMILSAGARLSLSLVPRDLEPFYGKRAPAGLTLFMTLRARAHRLDEHASMGH